jgi:NAD(P)-dependent dehydrogenase (short-subunit alcohol dehydrogenase family)
MAGPLGDRRRSGKRASARVGETVDRFGGLDVLFNNVGIRPQELYRRLEDITGQMWDRILDVNLKSYFLMSKFALPELRRRGGGVVVNTASVQGLQSQKGVLAYAASKGGVLSLTGQMALDYAADGIRVLAVRLEPSTRKWCARRPRVSRMDWRPPSSA